MFRMSGANTEDNNYVAPGLSQLDNNQSDKYLINNDAFIQIPPQRLNESAGDTSNSQIDVAADLTIPAPSSSTDEHSSSQTDQKEHCVLETQSSSESKQGWTVKGILSSIKEKVQEPTDSSAPVGKFYYDSVNIFQGVADSDSSSDGGSPRQEVDHQPSAENPFGFSSSQSRVSRSRSDSAVMTLRNIDRSPSGDLGDTLHHHHKKGGSILDSALEAGLWDESMVTSEDIGNDGVSLFSSSNGDRGRKNTWYWKLWKQIKRQQSWVFLLCLGICAATLGMSMEQTMHSLIYGRNYLASNLTQNYFVNYMLWVLFALVSCSFAAFLVHYVAPYAAGSGIPAVKSILSGVIMEHYLSFRTMTIKVVGLICVYAAGMFVGKEGPYVHIATALASQLSKLPFFSRIQRNEGLKLQLFAAGCAAGVAVTFGAPIGGVIFSIEVTTTYYLIQNLSKGFFCAIVATLFVHLLDTQGLIAFFSTDFAPAPYTSTELVAFSLIGISFGLLGVLFIVFVKKIAQLRRQYKILNLDSHRYAQVLVIAAISALATFPLLPLRAGPTAVINDLFSTSPLKSHWRDPNVYFTLSAVVVLQFIMTAVSIGLPIPCGLYTPLFVLGAALGRLIGEILQSLHFIPKIVPAGYAVVGAAAFAAATTRTLSSAIICFELTRQLEHLLPVVLAVLIASAVGSFFGPSIYDELLQLKGLPYMPPFKSHGSHRSAKSIMRTHLVYLTTESTFQEIQNLLINSHYSSFPLLHSHTSKTLLGVIPRTILENMLERLEKRLHNLSQRQLEYLNTMLQDDLIYNNPVQQNSSSSAEAEPAPERMPSPPATPVKTLEHKFVSRYGGLAAKLNIDVSESNDDAQQLQTVLEELTHKAMNEEAGLSRKTHGLDTGPFQLPVQTSVSRVHFLFAMLGLKCCFIVDRGQLVGVITKRDMIALQ